jgi:hypothetical protein
MKTVLEERSLDWALIHHTRFCDNDFFPPAFEFELLAKNWQEVRNKVQAIDLETHIPRPPLVRYAQKFLRSLRVLHRLDPVDSLVYTALVHEIHGALQSSRDAASDRSIRSLNVDPTPEGSFFGAGRNPWKDHLERLGKLANEYKVCGLQNTGGFVLITDIQDFYGHIQPDGFVRKLVDSGAMPQDRARVLGRALSAICAVAGAGIPLGNAASTALAELAFADIDAKILHYTPDFTRWVDDLHMFFRTREEAEEALEDLSKYLLTKHGMTLVPGKTSIVSVDEFLARSFQSVPAETADLGDSEKRLSQFATQSLRPIEYAWMTAVLPTPRPMNVQTSKQEMPEFQAVGAAYLAHFNRAVESDPPDFRTARRIMRKAGRCGIPTILPSVLKHFERLTPLIREEATYLKSVLNDENIRSYAHEIRKAWQERQRSNSYVNDWWCYLMTSPCFNKIDLPADYSEISDTRNKALIALRKNDAEWVRRNAAHLDAFDLWDKRAVLYACSVLLPQERAAAAMSMRRGITEVAVARHLEPGAHSPAARSDVKATVMGADNYSVQDSYSTGAGNTTGGGYRDDYLSTAAPAGGGYGDGYLSTAATAGIYQNATLAIDYHPAYGGKQVQPTPRWLMERIPELDALLNEHGSKIMVSFQDSVDSGNCMSGTETYRRELLSRLGLPSDTQTVAASVLLADRADPLTRRSARVAAWRFMIKNPA